MELGKVGVKYNLIIVSDEIHSDLVFEGNTHFLIASLSEKLAAITITFSSMCKTFNLAGLASGFVIIPKQS
ncbi:MAG TPA: aminotransferase class I/II-fold pyridoxal phosphate-dependent enzyme [Bacteroidales bacterium]|nr:aminotransferase class I/II-fold pyridoxal phosphate-dependent enzyme [Bacteroidales bacterium]